MAEEKSKVLIELEVKAGEALTNLEKAKKRINELRDANKDLSKNYALNTKQIVANEQEIKKLQQVVLVNTKTAQAAIVEVNKETGAYRKLELQYALAAQKAKDLSVAYGVNSKQAREAQKDASKLNDKLKEVDATTGQHHRNIGNYQSALEGLGGGMGGFVSGMRGMIKAGMAFIATPIGIVIGAIGLALKGLKEWFTKTETGASTLTKTTSGLGAVLKLLSGYVTGAVQGFVNFVSGIKSFPDLLTKIGQAIQDNLIKRFNGFAIVFKGIGKLLKRDFTGGLADITDGMIQIGTGVEGATGKIKKLADETGKVADEGARIAKMERDLDKDRVKSQVTIQNLTDKMAKYEQLMTKLGKQEDLKERLKAFDLWAEADEKIDAIQFGFAERQVAINKAKFDAAKKANKDLLMTSGSEYDIWQKSIAELDALRASDEREANDRRLRRIKIINDTLTLELKAMQDTTNAAVKEQEVLLNTSNASLVAKEEALNKIKALQDKSYQDQINKLEEVGGRHLDLDAIVKETDANKAASLMASLALNDKELVMVESIVTARKAAITATTNSEKKLFEERQTRIVTELKETIAAENAKQDEINAIAIANKTLTTEQLHAIDLKKIEDDKRIAIAEAQSKLSFDKTNQEEVNKAIEVVNNQFRAKTAQSNAQFEESERVRKLNAEQQMLADKASVMVSGSIEETRLKNQILKNQMTEELSVANLTGEQKLAITEKYNKMIADNNIASFDLYSQKVMEVFSSIGKFKKAQDTAALNEIEKNTTKQTALLDERLKKGIISEEQYNKKKDALDKQAAAKKLKIQIAAAKREKNIAYMEAVVNTASAVVKALNTKPILLGIALAAAAGIAGAAQIATIKSQPLPKASRGKLLYGASHASGGIPIEAEGGEAIINKKSTSMFTPLLSAINEAGGGVRFASGGIPTDGGFASRQSMPQNQFAVDMQQAMSQVKIQVAVEDIVRGQSKYAKIQNAGRI
jgi:hypothetical protein